MGIIVVFLQKQEDDVEKLTNKLRLVIQSMKHLLMVTAQLSVKISRYD
jgi:hypothetical protein